MRRAIRLAGMSVAAYGAALLLASAPAQAQQWETYLAEDFTGEQAMFPVGEFGEASYTVDNSGRYIINGMDSAVDSLAALTDSAYYYRIDADCQVLSSTAGELAFCGLLFHYKRRPGDEKPSYYVFYVYGDGFYGVKRMLSTRTEVLLPLTRTDALDASRPNQLAVEARGSNFDLYINGEHVNSFSDVGLDGGGFGFYISKHTIGAFDNFGVGVEPRPAAATTRQPTTAESGDRGPSPSGGTRGYRAPAIPRDPNRPLYPWEVGYDKNVNRKKRQQESASRERPAERGDELRRDTTSRRPSTESGDVPSLREQEGAEQSPAARRTTSSEPEPREAQRPPRETASPPSPPPAARTPAEPTRPLRRLNEPVLTEDAPMVREDEPVVLEDEPARDTSSETELPDTGADRPVLDDDDELFYRPAPGFDPADEVEPAPDPEPEPEPLAEPEVRPLELLGDPPVEPEVPSRPQEVRRDEPEDTEPTSPRRRGLNVGADDWDSAEPVQFHPSRRLPVEERAHREAEQSEPTESEAEAQRTVDEQEQAEAARAMRTDTRGVDPPEARTALSEPVEDTSSLEVELLDIESAQHLDDTEPEPIRFEPADDEPLSLTGDDPLPLRSESNFELPDDFGRSTPADEFEMPASEPDPPLLARVDDDFSDRSIWMEQQSDTSRYFYHEGDYRIDNLAAETMAISYQQDSFSDAHLQIDAAHIGGLDHVGFGIAGRFNYSGDNVSYYGLFVSASGEFMLLKVINGRESVLHNWVGSPLLNAGGTNRIGLQFSGDRITALVNGQEVASVQDADIPSGGFALLAGPGVAARFDNLQLSGSRL